MILDCTLRDGGYINNWKFGEDVIRNTIGKLIQTNIDIVECGFLRDIPYDSDISVFNSIDKFIPFITPKKIGVIYVGMIAVGDIEAAKIERYTGESLDGIRITFHKHEWIQAQELASNLMDKGYKVFMQPVGTSVYSDQKLLELVAKVNILNPFAFYIVDTLGSMYKDDVLHKFLLIDKNLDNEIVIGYHSHNNLQMAFANAQNLLSDHRNRQIILDASIYGMGRAAGNLCTELITKYINDNIASRYDITPLLEIYDEYLAPIYSSRPWGYSVPYFLAASEGVHPNYASYLMNKQTLNVKKIGVLLNYIPQDKRDLYDQNLIEELYRQFQDHAIDDTEARMRISLLISGRPLLVLAPGKSLSTNHQLISDFIKNKSPFIIAINTFIEEYGQDIVFVSNLKRFSRIEQKVDVSTFSTNFIITSNLLQSSENPRVFLVDYASLLSVDSEADNAGMMLLRLLKSIGAKEVFLAGFDGFLADSDNTYYTKDMSNTIDKEVVKNRHAVVQEQISQIAKNIRLTFITPSDYKIRLFRQYGGKGVKML
jgi:4-hydroxy 2-oxovalerate aldolase